jgi:Trypsin-co-occurring domain 1
MAKSRAAQSHSPDILLEVRPAPVSGDLAPRAMVPEEFRSRAGEVAESIAEVVETFRSRLGRLLDKRDDSAWRVGSIEVAFDIAVQAEAGVIIAKATAGATFSARLVLKAAQEKPR